MTMAHRKMARSAHRSAILLAGAAAIAGGAVACNLILGTSSFSACGAMGDAGWYTGDCLSCVEANCCDQAAACAADPACSAQQTCQGKGFPLLSCPLAGGVHASANGMLADAGALGACATERCSVACGEPWACAGHVPPPPTTDPDAGDVTVTLVPTSFSGGIDKEDAPALVTRVSWCPNGGAACEVVYDGPAAGPVQIHVPRGVPGYLDVVPAPGWLHSLVYATWPIVTSTTLDLRLLTPLLAHNIANLHHVQVFDADAGTLVVVARDCNGDPANGVTLTPSVDPTPFATSDAFNFPHGQPEQAVPGAAALQAPTTTSNGIAGWAEVNPDYTKDSGSTATFSATLDGGATSIGTVSVLVQAQTVTYVWLTPMPPP